MAFAFSSSNGLLILFFKKPLVKVLDGLSLISEADQLPRLIPNIVLVHHYVKFRLFLRR